MSYKVYYVKICDIDTIANYVEELNIIASRLFPWVTFVSNKVCGKNRLSVWEELYDIKYKSCYCYSIKKSKGFFSNKFIIKSPTNLLVIDEQKKFIFLSCKWNVVKINNIYNTVDPLISPYFKIKEAIMSIAKCDEAHFMKSIRKVTSTK